LGESQEYKPVNYAQLLLPDFSLIALGYVLCCCTSLKRSIWQGVEVLVYYLLFPVLLFYSVVSRSIDWVSASNLLVAGVFTTLLGIVLACSLPHWPLLGQYIDRHTHTATAQVAFRFNSYITLALAQRLLDAQGMLLIAMLIGVCVPLVNIVTVYLMARGHSRGVFSQLLRNPPIVATLSGITCNAVGWQLPSWLEPGVARLGSTSIVLGLMCVGAGMQLGALNYHYLLSGLLLGIRHIALPLIALGMVWLWGLTGIQALALMLFSGMPTAPTCYVLAVRMGYDGAYVAGLITLSTLLGLFSLPFALSLLPI